MPALTRTARILAEHAPYLSKHTSNKLCLTCLTADCGGEFHTVIEWALHVERILNGRTAGG